MNTIGTNITVTYREAFNQTVCKCHSCNKWWTFEGAPGEMTVGDMSFLLSHDRGHNIYFIEALKLRDKSLITNH